MPKNPKAFGGYGFHRRGQHAVETSIHTSLATESLEDLILEDGDTLLTLESDE